jgi:hypothetical protein
MWHGAQCYILQDECPTRKKKLVKKKLKGFIHCPLGKLKIFALGSSTYSSSHGTRVNYLSVFNAIVQFSSMPTYLPYLGEVLPRYQLPQIFIRYATFMNAIIPFKFPSIFTYSLHAFTWNWGHFLHFHPLCNWPTLSAFTQRNKFLHYWTELSIKSPCLHLVFGPAFTPTSPLSEVSAK